jgi:hypothetical protein
MPHEEHLRLLGGMHKQHLCPVCLRPTNAPVHARIDTPFASLSQESYADSLGKLVSEKLVVRITETNAKHDAIPLIRETIVEGCHIVHKENVTHLPPVGCSNTLRKSFIHGRVHCIRIRVVHHSIRRYIRSIPKHKAPALVLRKQGVACCCMLVSASCVLYGNFS